VKRLNPAAARQGQGELLELDFYITGLSRNLLKGSDLELVTAISDHEEFHVAAFTGAIKTLGGTPITRPKFNHPANSWLSRDGMLKNASTLEELGVSASGFSVSRNGDTSLSVELAVGRRRFPK